jgi:hypothetical protein
MLKMNETCTVCVDPPDQCCPFFAATIGAIATLMELGADPMLDCSKCEEACERIAGGGDNVVSYSELFATFRACLPSFEGEDLLELIKEIIGSD